MCESRRDETIGQAISGVVIVCGCCPALGATGEVYSQRSAET